MSDQQTMFEKFMEWMKEQVGAPVTVIVPPPPKPKSELEMIIAGIEYPTPVSGWPTPVIPQPQGKDLGSRFTRDGKTYQWIATSSKGAGFYAIAVNTPLPKITTLDKPREVPGLYAVLMEVEVEQDFRNKAYNALVKAGGTLDTVNANAQADPLFNAAVSHVLAGATPESQVGQPGGGDYTLEQLKNAKAVAGAL